MKRIFVGIIGIPVILFLIFKGGIYFLIFSLLIQSICIYEFNGMFVNKKYYPLKVFTVFISISLMLVSYLSGSYLIFCFLIAIVLILSFEVFRKEKRNPINSILSVFSLFYITVPFILLNELLKTNEMNIVVYIVVLIWSCDIFAYFGGKYFGKHPLNSISPNKTVEGSIIGFVFTVIASLIFFIYFPETLSLKDALILGGLIGFIGQVGDLFESMLKRYNETKDSSQIIPGHGGVLDRFDSLIFVTPIVFVYLNYFK
jgi:phosphatidate cytidylyltransferase